MSEEVKIETSNAVDNKEIVVDILTAEPSPSIIDIPIKTIEVSTPPVIEVSTPPVDIPVITPETNTDTNSDTNDDIFITENDTFEGKVRYYKNEKKEVIVQGVIR